MEMKENGNSMQQPMQQTVIVQQEQRKSNGMGTAGFVLALIGFFFSWIPILGWVIWFLGVLFSPDFATQKKPILQSVDK